MSTDVTIWGGRVWTFPDDFYGTTGYEYITNNPLLYQDIASACAAAVAAGVQLGYSTSSSTSISDTDIDLNKAITVEASKGFITGQLVKGSYTSDFGQYWLGEVVSYSGTTLTVYIYYTTVTAARTAWAISMQSGNVTCNTGTSTAGAIALFNGTAGNDIKAMTSGDLSTVLANLGVSGTQEIPVMVGFIQPRNSGGCGVMEVIEPSANGPNYRGLPFDATTQEYAQFTIPLPTKWNRGTITAKFLWTHASAAADNRVAWNIAGVAVSNDDAFNVAFGTARQVNDGASSGGTANDLYLSDATAAITIAGTPAAGDLICFQVSRVATDATYDIMSVDAYLLGVILYIEVSAGNDE